MADSVKLYGTVLSAYVSRAKMALNLKGIKYENIEEDLSNKSADLLKNNPVHKKVPVLVHNGKPISESLVIVEILTRRSSGVPAIKAVGTNGDDHQAIAEACAQLQVLENELKIKGTKFFGGDNIGLVDIAADFIAYWHGIREEAAGVTFFTKEKFPKLTKWADDFVNCQAVKNTLPPREQMLGFYMKFFGKVNGK
ncbi:hypothetical protein LXL04_032651 [Taraxacum kok-saghyz]